MKMLLMLAVCVFFGFAAHAQHCAVLEKNTVKNICDEAISVSLMTTKKGVNEGGPPKEVTINLYVRNSMPLKGYLTLEIVGERPLRPGEVKRGRLVPHPPGASAEPGQCWANNELGGACAVTCQPGEAAQCQNVRLNGEPYCKCHKTISP
jgi:hypothetical protein